MKKDRLITGGVGIVIGLLLGYGVAYFAPYISAQVFPGFQVRGGNPFLLASVEQCIANCQQSTTQACPQRGPQGTPSKTTHPFCTSYNVPGPGGKTRGKQYQCNESVCVGGTVISGNNVGEILSNPSSLGYVRHSVDAKGVETWFGHCPEVKCRRALRGNYWSANLSNY